MNIITKSVGKQIQNFLTANQDRFREASILRDNRDHAVALEAVNNDDLVQRFIPVRLSCERLSVPLILRIDERFVDLDIIPSTSDRLNYTIKMIDNDSYAGHNSTMAALVAGTLLNSMINIEGRSPFVSHWFSVTRNDDESMQDAMVTLNATDKLGNAYHSDIAIPMSLITDALNYTYDNAFQAENEPEYAPRM